MTASPRDGRGTEDGEPKVQKVSKRRPPLPDKLGYSTQTTYGMGNRASPGSARRPGIYTARRAERPTVSPLFAPCGTRGQVPPPESIFPYGANRPTQRPHVRNVYCWHWLSKRKAKTKKIASQCFARPGALCGWTSFVAGQLSKSARQRISMDGRSSRDCLSATGHAFHW